MTDFKGCYRRGMMIPSRNVFAVSILALLFTTLNALGQEVENIQGPILKLDTAQINFGELYNGDIVDHSFKLTNTGDEPLKIFDLRGS